MADNAKPVVDLILPSQNPDVVQKNAPTNSGFNVTATAEEMPTVTSLLNRKKLTAIAQPAQNAAPLFEIDPNAGIEPAESVVVTEPGEAAIVNNEQPAAISEAQNIISPDIAAPDVFPTDAPPVIAAPSHERGANMSLVESEQPAAFATGEPGAPPIFSRTLILESLDIGAFQKAVARHKKSSNMKKLDCLGYLSTRFNEIAYFAASDSGTFQGVLGFGNTQLVVHIRSQTVTPQTLPTIFEDLSQGGLFVGAGESLAGEDQAAISNIGFSQVGFVGAFPLVHKKSFSGLWLCVGTTTQVIMQKELVAIKKLFSSLVL